MPARQGHALYNEIKPYAADWIENLVRAGHVTDGVVDRRSIVDLQPDDVRGYRQAHFFAGVAVWSHALRLAGWPDDLEVWTGSCPCNPFSQAGRKRGADDERHLWPEWFRLIRECRPAVVFGEQVASPLVIGKIRVGDERVSEAPAGRPWLDLVFDEMEGEGYACWACDTPACSVGAPHIRQRLYWVAVRGDVLGRCRGATRPVGDGRDAGAVPRAQGEGAGERCAVGRVADVAIAAGAARGLADDDEPRRGIERREGLPGVEVTPRRPDADGRGALSGLADDVRDGLQGRSDRRPAPGATWSGGTPDVGGPVGGFWRDAEWIPCRDGKLRPIERRAALPGTFKMADGSSAWLERVRAAGPLVEWKALPDPKPSRGGMLKAFGNAIVAPLAAEFIGVVLEVLGIEPKRDEGS